MSAKVGIQKIYDELAIYGITKYNISILTEGGLQLSDMGKLELTLLEQPVERVNRLFTELYSYGIEKVFAHYYDEEHAWIDEEEEEIIQEDEENSNMDETHTTSEEDMKYLAEVNGVYEKCTQQLAKHGITDARGNKIFHTLYRDWGMSLLSDRLDEFIEVFGQMYKPDTTNDIALTREIMKAYEEKPNMLGLYEAAMKSRRDRREAEITEIKCREESGEISSEKAQALLKSYEHLNEWELV